MIWKGNGEGRAVPPLVLYDGDEHNGHYGAYQQMVSIENQGLNSPVTPLKICVEPLTRELEVPNSQIQIASISENYHSEQ